LVKNSKGTFILTGKIESVPSDVMSRLDAVVDGIVELGVVKTVDSTTRTLSVRKMTGRRISHQPVEFEIVSGKGVRFQGAKIPTFLRRLDPTTWRKRENGTKQAETSSGSQEKKI
ncbi:MAG TPA: ATPase domain-containing protein, partial [Candidatus Bathyarchaeia archaeon]